MKLLEYWNYNNAHKLVVKHWWGGVREYFNEGNSDYNIWRNSKGRKVLLWTDNALGGLLWVAQRKEKLQLHKIAFDKLTEGVKEP